MKVVAEKIIEGLSDTTNDDTRRLFHGRGGVYPSLNHINADWFKPVLLITLYQEPDDDDWLWLIDQLSEYQQTIHCLLVQRRYMRGAPLECLWGSVPEEMVAKEQGLQFALSFGGKQNVGFFLDMKPGRRWTREIAKGKRVLNLFSYTCAFSVAAIAGGAKTVMNVDMSKAALEVGRRNHQLNGQRDKLQRDIQFLPYNLFRSWKRIINKGPYDIVIIDPPSRQKGSFVAEQDYGKVIKKLTSLMPEGGDILACLNAPTLAEEFLHHQLIEHCPEAEFVKRLDNAEEFPELDSNRNLKMLHYRLMPSRSKDTA